VSLSADHYDDTAIIGFTILPPRIGAGVGYRATKELLLSSDLVWLGASKSDLTPEDDITELHFGGEYMFKSSGEIQLIVRGGAYANMQSNRSDFSPSKGVGTAGFGIVAMNIFQVDFAATTDKEVLLSAALRFRK